MIFDFFRNETPGEKELIWKLREYGYFIDDVSGDPAYWTRDIDLLVTPIIPKIGEDRTHSIEIKWDRRLADTGNLFIELENPRSIGGRG